MIGLHSSDQGLAGHAADVDAGATDGALLHHGHARSQFGSPDGRSETGRPGANDHQVHLSGADRLPLLGQGVPAHDRRPVPGDGHRFRERFVGQARVSYDGGPALPPLFQ